MMNDIELLAPAGSFETARAAFAAGADAVYLGLDAFSARADAVNFSLDDLRNLLALARPSKKIYITFNTVIDEADLPAVAERLALLEKLRPDGLIVQDLGVARLVRRHFPALPLHASTQLVAHNLEGVLALKDLGFTRVVLARELSLDEIRLICRRAGVEIEVFVHGALCYSVSGLCLFSALEKNRSGNRGRCAYCCRLPYTDPSGARTLPFSMRDLRLDDCLDALKDAGVASLKIEGRMKSPLYVASVTSRYRQLLDGAPVTTTRADLETVFSRRTTSLYVRDPHARPEDVLDPASLGHLGTPVGAVKRLTKDREGRVWLRFHTNRALEKHDGLQFATPGGKPVGFGIGDMRLAISRRPVFEAPRGGDVEILLPPALIGDPALRPGATVYCSASNEVKRRFPVPPFRPSSVRTGTPIDIALTLAPDGLAAAVTCPDLNLGTVSVTLPAALAPARNPEQTRDSALKFLSRLGSTDWSLGVLTLHDPDRLFAPSSLLNTLRRELVARLDAAKAAAEPDLHLDGLSIPDTTPPPSPLTGTTLKIRLDQPLPNNLADFSELIIAVGHTRGPEILSRLPCPSSLVPCPLPPLRLALPVFTHERDFNALRHTVKHLLRAGHTAWEAADLATLRLLRQLGVTDITADWTLYAFNSSARAQLAELGVTRFVASPENSPENLLALSTPPPSSLVPCPLSLIPSPEFLLQQSTPLFISLTRPAVDDPSALTSLHNSPITSFPLEDLWITTRPTPRVFTPPPDAPLTRLDLSWDPPR